MRLFELANPLTDGPAGYAEPEYDYLCRSARPEASAVRALVEHWLSLFPAVHRGELIPRLRSRDAEHFFSAFWELYLFALFRGLGLRVRVHPRLRHAKGRRPDFAVTKPGGDSFLVEGALVFSQSAAERSAAKRLSQAYDALNRLQSPEYFVWLRIYGEPRSPIPAAKLRTEVSAFLEGLDYNSITSQARDNDLWTLPSHRFTHDGCTVEVSPIPKSSKARGNPDARPIGMLGPGEARSVDYRTPLRRVLLRKASYYGRSRRPYLIAVNAVDHRLEKIDVMQALFGTETYVLSRGQRFGSSMRMLRRADGVWHGPNGPTHTRVSAVLVASRVTPWNVAKSLPSVYHNPWTHLPLAALPRVGRHEPKRNKMITRSGATGLRIFRLPSSWPFEGASA